MDRARRFRESARQHNQDRERMGWRYPAELRALAVEHCQAERDAGRAYSAIAAELGITPLTLSRWLSEPPPQELGVRERRLVPVEVVDEPPRREGSSGLCVVTPAGWRIEGLAWPQVLELARELR